jgi:hypothetical protein
MMAIINGYATLTDYKNNKDIQSSNVDDDSVIEQLIEGASRFIDEKTAKTFYPRIQTRYQSVPEYGLEDADELWLDDSLLEVITLTNGNGVVVSANDYYPKPRNDFPKYAICLKDSASIAWTVDAAGNDEYVIAVNALWGFHDEYQTRGWLAATAINKGGGITAVESPITVDQGLNIQPGKIVRIDNEIMICKASDATTFTPMARGDNGSTAAVHLDDAVIFIWTPMPTIRMACLEIVKSAYSRRFGTNTTGTATITGAGVVITPEEVPAFAWNIINTYKPDVP